MVFHSQYSNLVGGLRAFEKMFQQSMHRTRTVYDFVIVLGLFNTVCRGFSDNSGITDFLFLFPELTISGSLILHIMLYV